MQNSGSVSVPCPGTRENTVWLAYEPMRVRHVRNAGTCRLFVDYLDASHNRLLSIPLDPGDSDGPYDPPEGTAAVIVACSEECHGEGGLEFELEPILIA